jgi:hypothetical protein
MDWMTVVQFPVRHYLHSGSGVHPVICKMSTGVLSLGIYPPGCEANRLSLYSARLKNALSYTFSFHICVWHGA